MLCVLSKQSSQCPSVVSYGLDYPCVQKESIWNGILYAKGPNNNIVFYIPDNTVGWFWLEVFRR